MTATSVGDTMLLGRTEVRVPPLGLGTWQWGDTMFWGYGKGYAENEIRAAFDASLAGGVMGDKFGTRRVLVVSSLLAGLLGAARGLAVNFASITVIVLLLGALIPFVTMNSIKAVGQWFPPQQLGLANGLISMGMAFGFLLGSLLSATTFSPLLGGWRNVLIAYGLAGALFSLPWFFARELPLHREPTGKKCPCGRPFARCLA